jgi:hypothetical protein
VQRGSKTASKAAENSNQSPGNLHCAVIYITVRCLFGFGVARSGPIAQTRSGRLRKVQPIHTSKRSSRTHRRLREEVNNSADRLSRKFLGRPCRARIEMWTKYFRGSGQSKPRRWPTPQGTFTSAYKRPICKCKGSSTDSCTKCLTNFGMEVMQTCIETPVPPQPVSQPPPFSVGCLSNVLPITHADPILIASDQGNLIRNRQTHCLSSCPKPLPAAHTCLLPRGPSPFKTFKKS